MLRKTNIDNTWNWVVSVRDENNHFCSGSILNQWYIITTAYCFEKRMHRLSNIKVCWYKSFVRDLPPRS